MAEPHGGSDPAVEQMIQSLQATTLFKGLENAEVKFLLRHGIRQTVSPFQTVIEERSPGDSLFYILKGEVYLTRMVGEEEEFLGILRKGDSFGEAGLLMGGVRTAAAKTKTESLLLEFDKKVIEELPRDLALKLMRNIAIGSGEKLALANQLIGRLYEELREYRPRDTDWEAQEEEFIQDFDDPDV